MVKIYHNGVRINTPWQVFKAKVKYTCKVLVWIIVTTGVVVGIAMIGGKVYPQYVEVKQEVVLDNLKGKIDELKGKLIKDMFDNERGGHTEADGLITWDPNPNHKNVQVASLGSCQFKQSTVQYYTKTLNGLELNGKQANDIAFSDEKCKELMADIVFKVKEGHEEWYNTCKKINCDGRLLMIRELEK